MRYTVITKKGEESGVFMGADLEGLKKLIKKLKHNIKKVIDGTPDKTRSDLWLPNPERMGRRAHH
jgi:hypothetical protein